MKSKTSFFNPTVFKKDVTRFAPCWALYSLFLAVYLLMLSDNPVYSRAIGIADAVGGTSILMMLYALVTVQLLFGDLYNARMCNALHAMPLRRECWFVTHAAAGLSFALVPNLVLSLVALPLLGEGWSVALWWLLGSTLEYLFFFGLAVLCALCAGNRFSMALVYGICNFLSMLAYWFCSTLFEPLLYGIRITMDPFQAWCPVGQMACFYDLVEVQDGSYNDPVLGYIYDPYRIESVTIGEGWGYLAICAVIGVVLLGLALLLYRKRKLECAGDFMAVRALEPVFLVLYTLTAGCLFQVLCYLFVGRDNDYLFLAIGILVGFFTGLMLLNRTTRVFKPRAFLGLGLLGAALALSLLLASLDIFGITRIIPDQEDIVSIRFGETYSYNDYYFNNQVTVTDEADFENILYIHRYALGEVSEYIEIENDTISFTNVGILYTLSDGSTLRRYYTVPTTSSAGQILKDYYSDPSVVLSCAPAELADLDDLADRIYCIYTGYDRSYSTEGLDVRGLLDAILADCQAGNLVQIGSFHDYDSCTWLSLDYTSLEKVDTCMDFTIYQSCENTLAWLIDNGFYEPYA